MDEYRLTKSLKVIVEIPKKPYKNVQGKTLWMFPEHASIYSN